MAGPFIHNPAAGPVGERVGRAWYNDNAADYVSPFMPTLTAPGQKALHKGAGSYLLEKLENMIFSSAEAEEWSIGDLPPAGKPRDKDTINYAMINHHGASDPWPLEDTPGGGDHAREYWESYAEVTGQMYGRAWQRRDYKLAEFLTTAANFGNGSGGVLAFTGTQDIDDRDTSGDQQPIRDMKRQATILKKWRKNGLKLTGIGDPNFLLALTTHLEFHGGLTGSATAAGITEELAIQRLKALLGLDQFFNLSSLVNASAIGVTASVNYAVSTGFFWIGLLASGDSTFKSSMGRGPDGAFAIAQSSSPWVKKWKDEGREVVVYADRDESAPYLIRGADMGRCFTSHITT